MATVSEPLVLVGDLYGLDGAPFTQEVVQPAAEAIRTLCGWHIAPEVTQTVVLDHDGGRVLRLPSLRVVDVESVRDLSGTTPRDLTGWRWSAAGMLEGTFPRGFRCIEVTFTHGYQKCPDDLLPVIADATTLRRVRSQQAGPFNVAYEPVTSTTANPEAVLSRYALGPRP